MACTCTCYNEKGVAYPCSCPCSDTETPTYASKALTTAREEKAAADKRTKEYEEGVKEIKELSDKITDKEIVYIKTIYDAYSNGIPEDILKTLKDRYGKEVIDKIIDVLSTTTLIISEPPISSFTATSGKTYFATEDSTDPNTPSSTRDLEPEIYHVWYIRCRDSTVPYGYPPVSEGGHGCCQALDINFGEDYAAYSEWISQYASSIWIYDQQLPPGNPPWTGINMQTAIANCASSCCQPTYDNCEGLIFSLRRYAPETIDPATGQGQANGVIEANIVWADYPGIEVDVQLIDTDTGVIVQTIYAVVLPATNLIFSNLPSGNYAITLPGNFIIPGDGPGGQDDIYIQDCTENIIFPIELPACMNPNACNYNPEATLDDGSCLFDDCAGICGGDAYLDNCDNCVGGTLGGTPCEEDCAGVWGGTFQTDECGECEDPLGELWNLSCTDCEGTVNGPNLTDICGECNDPNNPTLWNRECTGCLDKCAINYDPSVIQGCDNCCLHIDFKVNCTCCESTNTPSITIYWFHPQGTNGTLTGGTIVYGTTTVTIPDGTAFLSGQTSDGQYYSYLTVDLGSAGAEVVDGIYTLKFDSLTAVDGGGAPLTPTSGIQVKKCDMVLCSIESSLQKYMKDIILANKCCDCEALSDTYYKAWTLYRALKITSTCGIDDYVDDTIKEINVLIKEMKNSICNKC